jgi:hypothetical protein
MHKAFAQRGLAQAAKRVGAAMSRWLRSALFSPQTIERIPSLPWGELLFTAPLLLHVMKVLGPPTEDRHFWLMEMGPSTTPFIIPDEKDGDKSMVCIRRE